MNMGSSSVERYTLKFIIEFILEGNFINLMNVAGSFGIGPPFYFISIFMLERDLTNIMSVAKTLEFRPYNSSEYSYCIESIQMK